MSRTARFTATAVTAITANWTGSPVFSCVLGLMVIVAALAVRELKRDLSVYNWPVS